MKKIWALLICAALLLAVLAGCGDKTADGNGKSGDIPIPTEQPLVTDPDSIIAVGRGGTGFETYAPDTVVGTINGSEVSWMEYYYWLTYYARLYIDRAVEYGIPLTSWDAAGELSTESSNAEVIIASAQYMTKYYHAILTGTESMGVELSEQDRAELEELYASYADEDGDGEVSEEEAKEYEAFLAGQCIDKDFFMYLHEVALLTDLSFTTLYGKSAEKYSDEDTMAFIAESGYMSAKRIVLLTLDGSTGVPLDDETIAEKRELANRIYEDIAAADGTEERIARFDENMYEYSEDPGYVDYPDGYVFISDDTPLTEITMTLDENYGLSGVEETFYGFEIVMRQPVLPDTVEETDADGNNLTMRYLAAGWEQQILVNAWTETADVVWNKGFDAPDLTPIFG